MKLTNQAMSLMTLQPVKHHRLVIPDDDDEDDNFDTNSNFYSRNVANEESGSGSDSDSSKSDVYVRVGGRFRKERNALKGFSLNQLKDYRYISQSPKGRLAGICRNHNQFWSTERE